MEGEGEIMRHRDRYAAQKSRNQALGTDREVRLQLQIIAFIGVAVLTAGIVIEQIVLR